MIIASTRTLREEGMEEIDILGYAKAGQVVFAKRK